MALALAAAAKAAASAVAWACRRSTSKSPPSATTASIAMRTLMLSTTCAATIPLRVLPASEICARNMAFILPKVSIPDPGDTFGRIKAMLRAQISLAGSTRRGMVAAQVVLSMSVLMAMLAVVADGGLLLVERRHAQATADAAALAAACDLYSPANWNT